MTGRKINERGKKKRLKKENKEKHKITFYFYFTSPLYHSQSLMTWVQKQYRNKLLGNRKFRMFKSYLELF
jgi:hypothetical protein